MQLRVAPPETRQARSLPEPQLPLTPLGPATTQRFRSKYRIGKSGCWLWTSPLPPSGYARYTIGYKAYQAHRLSYETYIGPIPDGLQLDHLCRVRHCVNPTHVEPVTNWENLKRGVGPSAINARKTRCNRGHPYTEDNTHINPAGARRCRKCHRDRQRSLVVKCDGRSIQAKAIYDTGYSQRGICAVCGRDIGVYIPKGGDGSYVQPYPHVRPKEVVAALEVGE